MGDLMIGGQEVIVCDSAHGEKGKPMERYVSLGAALPMAGFECHVNMTRDGQDVAEWGWELSFDEAQALAEALVLAVAAGMARVKRRDGDRVVRDGMVCPPEREPIIV